MALIECPECKRLNVSDQAIACPSCGFPMMQKRNKPELQVLNLNGNIAKWAVIHTGIHFVFFVLIIFIMIKIVPVFNEIYMGFGSALPYPTSIIVNISIYFRKYFFITIPFFLLILPILDFSIYFTLRSNLNDKGAKNWAKFFYFSFVFFLLITLICLFLPILKLSENIT